MTLSHSTVTDLFTDIASAIRAKTGGTSTIIADAFPTAIASIPTANGDTDAWAAIGQKITPRNGAYNYQFMLGSSTFISQGTGVWDYVYLSQAFLDSFSTISNYMFANISIPVSCSMTFTNASKIGKLAFAGTPNAAGSSPSTNILSFPAVTSISDFAFSNNRCIYKLVFPSLASVYSSAFYYAGISKFEAPLLSYVPTDCFRNCWYLQEMSLSLLTSIGDNAFTGCSTLSYVSFPLVTSISSGAFSGCYDLASFYMPLLSYISYYAFASCRALTSVTLDNALYMNTGVFSNCTNLQTVNVPKCSSVAYQAFYNCQALTTVSLGSSAASLSIGTYAFSSCYNLLSLYLMGSVVAKLTVSAGNAFGSTPMTGYTASTGGVSGSIFVPASLLTAYKTSTNWVNISDRFVGV